jgi:hypothetical protein
LTRRANSRKFAIRCTDFVLSLTVQAVREVLKLLLNTKAKTMAQTALRLGAFMLLALPGAQCGAIDTTPQAGVKKAAGPAVAKKPSGTAAVKKPAPAATTGSPQGTAARAETSTADAAKGSPTLRLENARLDAVDSDYANMSLTDCVPGQPDPGKIVCNGKVFHIKVSDLALRAKLKQFHVGDHIRVDIGEKGELQDLRGPWSVPSDEISPTRGFLVLAACALAILGLATAVTKGAPLKFIVGMDNRYSNSKFQITLWFSVVMSTYVATVVFRVWYAGWDFFGGSEHPAEPSGAFRIERRDLWRSEGYYYCEGQCRNESCTGGCWRGRASSKS